MRLSEVEYNIMKQAVNLVLNRKSRSNDLGNCECAIVNVQSMKSKVNRLTQYHRNQIINAIATPLSMMFFLSNSHYNDLEIVEKLASYIEEHSFDISAL